MLVAKASYERALAIDEAALADNHPNVAIRLNNLGSVLRAQGDLTGANALLQRSLLIFRQTLGNDHSTTKFAEENLGLLEEQLKNAE